MEIMPARSRTEREHRKGNIGAAATLCLPMLILFTIPLDIPAIPIGLLVLGSAAVVYMNFRARKS